MGNSRGPGNADHVESNNNITLSIIQIIVTQFDIMITRL